MFKNILGGGTPISREQCYEMINSKIAKVKADIPSLVKNEITNVLSTNSGVSELLKSHRSNIKEDLKITESRFENAVSVAGKELSNILNDISEIGIAVRTEKSSYHTVDSLVSNSRERTIEERFNKKLAAFFLANIIIAVGIGIITANMGGSSLINEQHNCFV